MRKVEYPFAEVGVTLLLSDSQYAEAIRMGIKWLEGKIFQNMNNNLWDNHPYELDRWMDDGGRC